MAHAQRHKPRRLPLVLRFAKGAIHGIILVPVVLHSLWTVLVVYLDRHVAGNGLSIPSTIIPSLSIVVGLMLVFRNSTSYDRFWTGRNCLTTVTTCVRALARIILVNAVCVGEESEEEQDRGQTVSDSGIDVSNGKSSAASGSGSHSSKMSITEIQDTETAIRALVAVLYAIKHNLRAEFNIPAASMASIATTTQYMTISTPRTAPRSNAASRRPSMETGYATPKDEYSYYIPPHLTGFEDSGLSLPLQLSVSLESYIKRHSSPSPRYPAPYFHAPLSASLSTQLTALISAYGQMETIRSTPLPIAHQIHARQVLALYTCVLPFAIVNDYGWWAIPIVSLVAFTLYGIEGIGLQLEDPFGYDKNDIKMDGIVEDARCEVEVLLEEWRSRVDGGGRARCGMFQQA